MKGILRRVKGYNEVAAEFLTNPDILNMEDTLDEDRKDKAAGQWYIQGVDGKAYRVNSWEIENKLDSLPEPVKNALLDGHDVEVEFSTAAKPRGKYLWVKNFEFSDMDKLTSWADSQPK